MLFIIEDYANDQAGLKTTLKSIKKLENKDLKIETAIINGSDSTTLLSAIKSCDDYFCLIGAGDTIESLSAANFATLLNCKLYNVIKLKYVYNDPTFVAEFKGKKKAEKHIDLFSAPHFVPTWLYYYAFNKKIFENCEVDNQEALLYELYKYLYKEHTIYFDTSTQVITQSPLLHNAGIQQASNKAWYLDFLRYVPCNVIEDIKNGIAPLYIQSAVLYLFWARVIQNINIADKHIIDNEYDIFKDSLYDYIKIVDDDLLNGYGIFNPPNHFTISLLQLKYGDEYKINYVTNSDNNDVWIFLKNKLLKRVSDIYCAIDLIDYDKKSGNLIIDYYIEDVMDWSQFKMNVTVNGKKAQNEETYRYKHIKYFGKTAQKFTTFRATINTKEIDIPKSGALISFSLNYSDACIPITVKARTYYARLNTLINHSYWYFDKKYIMLAENKSGILIKKGFASACLKEIKGIYTLFLKTKDISLVKLRLLYWLTYPYFATKKIWLTYDKLYKGGDCGEYLYKYCRKRGWKNGITAAYVINGDCDDCTRLKNEGYKPLIYGSLKHLLYYLNSSVVFATHGGVYNFNGFTADNIRYFQHLLRHDVACIQHGLTVQQLAHNANRVYNNMKRYYCASKYEIVNLSKPIYGYEDKSLLKLTGIPRYDGLINDDKRQILITPTWRNYIAMPPVAKNQAKPYFHGFKETDYFKIYNELLSDEKLIETARATGYELVYLLHPVVSVQIDDYPQNDAVKIVPAVSVDYEKILTESSLMVTDYSGVQFDFAYMRKPVIYYHPPKLPPHYKEGGFFYDSMGFGEICTEHQELVDVLCEYMKNNCQMKDFYKGRADDFFAHSDLNSCQRIYDDMLEYQKNKK